MALCLWVSVSHPPKHVRTGLVGRFLAILQISDFCQKFEFWVFWGVIGHSGSLEMSVFLVFGRSQNFDFLGFFGRSENFGGQLWRCACGCQYDVRISQDSLDLIMMAYIFSPPLAPSSECHNRLCTVTEILKSQRKSMKS